MHSVLTLVHLLLTQECLMFSPLHLLNNLWDGCDQVMHLPTEGLTLLTHQTESESLFGDTVMGKQHYVGDATTLYL